MRFPIDKEAAEVVQVESINQAVEDRHVADVVPVESMGTKQDRHQKTIAIAVLVVDLRLARATQHVPNAKEEDIKLQLDSRYVQDVPVGNMITY